MGSDNQKIRPHLLDGARDDLESRAFFHAQDPGAIGELVREQIGAMAELPRDRCQV
jgi:hypothetical protein